MTDEPEIAPAPSLPEQRITPTVGSGLPEADVERITSDLIGALKTVYDPEIRSISTSWA